MPNGLAGSMGLGGYCVTFGNDLVVYPSGGNCQIYTTNYLCSSGLYFNTTYGVGENLYISEALQAAQQYAAEQERLSRKETERIDAANKRAEELLTFMLDEDQKKRYAADRCFEVVAGNTGERRRYLVKYGWAGNVEQIDENGRQVARFCIHPRNIVPVPDNMLAQKLMLESNEEEFLRIANRCAA